MNNTNAEIGATIGSFSMPGNSHSRTSMIIQVYALVGIQFVIAAVVFAAICFNAGVLEFIIQNDWPLLLSTVFLSIMIFGAMRIAHSKYRDQVPPNTQLFLFFLLIIPSSVASLMIDHILLHVKCKDELMAVGICSILIGLSFAIAKSKWMETRDTTPLLFYIVIVAVGATVLEFSMFLLIPNEWFTSEILQWLLKGFSYCYMTAVVLLIVCDTQVVLGGKSVQISDDDYVTGALLLSIDVFLPQLRLLIWLA